MEKLRDMETGEVVGVAMNESEWREAGKERTRIMGGRKYAAVLDDGLGGTVLVPVEIRS